MNKTLDPTVDQAFNLAVEAHRGQYRKGNCEPYVCHPIRVWWLVRDARLNVFVQAAALLHDVLEDTDRGILEFPRPIQCMVLALTKPEGGNKQDGIDKLRAEGNHGAVMIKLADRLDNLNTSTDAKMVNSFLPSTQELLSLARDLTLNESVPGLYEALFTETATALNYGVPGGFKKPE